MEFKKLGFECVCLPLADEKDRSNMDIEQTKKMVDTYLENGFNDVEPNVIEGGNPAKVLKRLDK